MLEIPECLMITPPKALACSELQEAYAIVSEALAGDDDGVLQIYLMHERRKGEASFWAPYFNALPSPGSVDLWCETELLELQDDGLVQSATYRRPALQVKYNRIVGALRKALPAQFDETYSFELWEWAWRTLNGM
jgi:hypothetical protein